MISPETASEWLKSGKAILVDVREPAEYQEERIKGSFLYPVSSLDIPAILDESKGKPVIFSCAKGPRAMNVWQIFTQQTGREAYCVEGSILGWKAAGLPTQKPLSTNLSRTDRQIMLIAGTVVLGSSLLAAFVSPGWIWVSATAGALMLLAGICGICLMKRFLTGVNACER